jgi:hypothetical protein
MGAGQPPGHLHARAKQVYGSVLNIATAYQNARVAPTLGGAVSPAIIGFAPQAQLDLTGASYPVIAYPTLEDLFGSQDYCNCDDCGSILSAAAYLVDLLNYIDKPSPTPNYQNPQGVLFQRRPDLQYLPLTCENTNVALPYIDIVNETLEYFVASGYDDGTGAWSLAGYQGHDTGDVVTSTELMASPQYVNDAAYAKLQASFFPPPLPFNRALEYLRLQMTGMGIQLPDAMIALRANDDLTNSSTPSSYGWSDILIEQLGISRDEYRLFTDPALYLMNDLYGVPTIPLDQTLTAAQIAALEQTALEGLQNGSLQDFSRRTGVSYDDLISIVETQFINPDAALIPKLQALGTTFDALAKLQSDPTTATAFISGLPPGLDFSQYGNATVPPGNAVVNWVNQGYSQISNIITIDNPTGNADDCSGAVLNFRYTAANPVTGTNLLTGTDFLKFIRFIRLWQKLAPLLGGDDHSVAIARTDAIITALYPAANLPVAGNNDAQNRQLLDAGFSTLLMRTGFLFQVMNRLSLTADSALLQLLSCWAPIGTVGSDSLYKRLFLTPTLLQQDPGAQTATVSSVVCTGDVFITTINNVSIDSPQVQVKDTAESMAVAIATAINSTTTRVDPTSQLPLNQRFHADFSGPVVTVSTGFQRKFNVSQGAETYILAVTSPISQSATVAGAIATGDVLIARINTVPIPYTTVASDTNAAELATSIAQRINATTTADPWSGLPINNVVTASTDGITGKISIDAVSPGPAFALDCSVNKSSGTYVATTFTPGGWTATINGAINAGDVIQTIITRPSGGMTWPLETSLSVSYTVRATDTDTSKLAGSIAVAISTSVLKDTATQLTLGSLIHATSVGNVVTISPIDPATTFSVTHNVSGGETVNVTGPVPQSQTATLGGSFSPGMILTTTINTVDVLYTVENVDLATISAGIASAVNGATAAIDPISGQPLNAVVLAASNGSGLTFTAVSAAVPFTFAVGTTASGYVAGRANPPFADNGYGKFLVDPSQTLFGHEPLICAACNLTGPDFASIALELGFDSSTTLTLEAVSAVFSFGWLARAIGMSVPEFILLRKFSGLDPFDAGKLFDPANVPAGVEPPVIRFIQLQQAIVASGLQAVQALYLIWNQDLGGSLTPQFTDAAALALALRADFAAVESQFSLQDDPTGAIAQSLMTLVYGADASAFFFGLLNSTFTSRISYSIPGGQPAFPDEAMTQVQNLITNVSGGSLSYDNLGKQLAFSGDLNAATVAILNGIFSVNTSDSTDNVPAGADTVLTPASMTNIYPGSALLVNGDANNPIIVTNVSGGSFTATTSIAYNGTATPFTITSDPQLPTAISNLSAANQAAIAAFFAQYPELQPPYDVYAGSQDLAANKRDALLASLLPPLKLKRKQEQALASITSAVGTDPGFANSLLQDSTILHAQGNPDPSQPAIADLTAVETSVEAFASVAGTITAGDVLTTTVDGTDVPYTVDAAKDTSLQALAASISAAINRAAQTQDPVSKQPLIPAVNASSDSANVIVRSLVSQTGAIGFSLSCSTSAGATESYLACKSTVAAGQLGLTWSNYLSAPQDGHYNFRITADSTSGMSVQIDSERVTGSLAGGVWSNSGPVSLTAGQLTLLEVMTTPGRSVPSVSWQTAGVGWEPVPPASLFPSDVIDRLQTTYVRFVKAVSLATALSLSPEEIAYLVTAPSASVNTTASAVVAPGSTVVNPVSMENIAVGSVLVIDSGYLQETVTVTAVTPLVSATSFTATFANRHDGTVQPFAIVSQASPALSEGWLNFLKASSNAVTSTPDATDSLLGNVLGGLLDFARMKKALSPADQRLMAVLENPAAAQTPSPLLALTGWSQASVNALLTQFFQSTDPATLSSVENFRRVFDAFAILKACRVNASPLLTAVTNAPTPGNVSQLQSALRALYAESDWLTVIKPINDTMRIKQRDALVAFILQQLGDSYASNSVNATSSGIASPGDTDLGLVNTANIGQGMLVQGYGIPAGTAVVSVGSTTDVTISNAVLVTIADGSPIQFLPPDAMAVNTADKLFEYLLIDVQNQPPVETSRIRLALSSVQLFIERIVRNLEPTVSPADIDVSQWQWMKRYRVWQANREVFLWPENWLYPELRDDQSPLFQEMMSSLLQSDITDDAASEAYLDYLTGLEEIAKLEPCGIYYQPGDSDTNEAAYVVSRTAGAHRKYYFRQLQNGSWTPWTEVKIECEDMPLTPILWNDNRLLLFWLKFLKTGSSPNPTDISSYPALGSSDVSNLKVTDFDNFGTASANAQSAPVVSAVLCYSEFYNGKWQPTKTSDMQRPIQLVGGQGWTGTGDLDSDRDRISIVPRTYRIPPLYAAPPKGPPIEFTIPDGALVLEIVIPEEYVGGGAGFVLFNSHSRPVRWQDLGQPTDQNGNALEVSDFLSSEPIRVLAPTQAYDGGSDAGTFSISYGEPLGAYVDPQVVNSVLGFTWMPRYVESQPGMESPWDWNSPFFYEDRRYLFYVTTSQNIVPNPEFPPLGASLAFALTPGVVPKISALNRQATRVVLGSTAPISYQGQLILPTGSIIGRSLI